MENPATESQTDNIPFRDKVPSFLKRFSPRQLLTIVIITLAIPLTVTLALQQQNLQKEASENDASKIKGVTAKPNIVIIMLDDINPMDGRLFKETRTPNIYQNIISKGVNFTNFYVETTLCCPGRAGFLTGQHTQNHGVKDLDGTVFNPSTTIATELKAEEYYTIFAGKYLNYYANLPANKLSPPGWDRFDSIYENQGKYYNYRFRSKSGSIVEFGDKASDYSTDVISSRAIERLKSAPIDKPVFAYLAPFAAHGQGQGISTVPAPRHVGDPRCKNINPWNPPSYNESNVSDKPTYIKATFKQEEVDGYDLVALCETILSVDDLVGKVKTELQSQGRLNNTIFILTADNGRGSGEHRMDGKTTPYTTLVPFYVAWPAGRGGSPRTDKTILSNIDLAPTLCELAGCVMGPYPNGQTIPDGVSFASLIKNQPINFRRYSILESQPVQPEGAGPLNRPAWWAIRTTEQHSLGFWHYVEYATGEKELYDVSNGPCNFWTPSKGGDPCELTNLLSSVVTAPAGTSEISSALASELAKLKIEKGFVQPSPTPSLSPSPTPTQSPTPTPVPQAPKGVHDSASCSVITGWTCDPNDYSQALSVHFYLDGPSGGSGTLIGQGIADFTRETAVGNQCGGNLSHGFSFDTPLSVKDGLPHQIYAYAINIGPTGPNPLLINSPKSLTCPVPTSTPPQPSPAFFDE